MKVSHVRTVLLITTLIILVVKVQSMPRRVRRQTSGGEQQKARISNTFETLIRTIAGSINKANQRRDDGAVPPTSGRRSSPRSSRRQRVIDTDEARGAVTEFINEAIQGLNELSGFLVDAGSTVTNIVGSFDPSQTGQDGQHVINEVAQGSPAGELREFFKVVGNGIAEVNSFIPDQPTDGTTQSGSVRVSPSDINAATRATNTFFSRDVNNFLSGLSTTVQNVNEFFDRQKAGQVTVTDSDRRQVVRDALLPVLQILSEVEMFAEDVNSPAQNIATFVNNGVNELATSLSLDDSGAGRALKSLTKQQMNKDSEKNTA